MAYFWDETTEMSNKNKYVGNENQDENAVWHRVVIKKVQNESRSHSIMS